MSYHFKRREAKKTVEIFQLENAEGQTELKIHFEKKMNEFAVSPESSGLAAVDERIEQFLNDYLNDASADKPIRMPKKTFILDRAGMARMMSLPPDKDFFESEIVRSYRVKQGVLHNPQNDRRTTQGVFHIADGGLPIPDDKIEVPRAVFKKLFEIALNPPASLTQIPYTSTQHVKAAGFISLLMRPLVCPEVKGLMRAKTMEVRFFAPGNLVSNLDFVESIFGNAGNPHLPENDASLDTEHWTGHTGCVVLAPHLTYVSKKELGLPHYDQATERQRRDGMCWKTAEEKYNAGQAFKMTCRDERGVIVTVIADNYFGYCKKEVKTQISYSANLFGIAEEEHSGGALAFPAYDLGEEFSLSSYLAKNENTFKDVVRLMGERLDILPEGYAVDRKNPEIIYVPENAEFNLPEQTIKWNTPQGIKQIKLLARHIYILPGGYKLFIKKQTGGHTWHLIGIVAEGVLCHKPCTVSGGGKSEISKSIVDAMIQGPVFTADYHKDLDFVDELIRKDYSVRFRNEAAVKRPSRPVLSSKRSLGSVIKLFTVSSEYAEDYNAWLATVPDRIKEILLAVKRFYRPEWGKKWRNYFGVDIVNGQLGHELKFKGRKIVANYLRVGREADGSWRTFRVRQDFAAAEKIQYADDITASAVIPARRLKGLCSEWSHPSVKIISNVENFLFQRPDDAIYRGFDKQAESDIASHGTFLSNYQPLGYSEVFEIVEDAIHFEAFTDPIKKLFESFLQDKDTDFVASSAHPRMVDGKPSKNPRYLQRRPDLVNPQKNDIAEIGVHLYRKVPVNEPVFFPVNAVLPGRRNNPPDRANNVPALAVYNPIHYQELPELFLDFVCSLTGKSPSTTGFGSEGALTKGPFNALWPVVDLNNALVSFIVSASEGFTSAAGYIGPKYKVDHDISLLMPEIWCRMRPEEQSPAYLIQHGFLEKVNDFEYKGRTVKAGILGYRITQKFANTFLGRVFTNPNIVFTQEMLAPEKQDLEVYVEGIENIFETQKRVAEHYFADESVESACPPLKALLYIMYKGTYEGKTLEHPDVRALFSRDAVLKSAWYLKRLKTKQNIDVRFWTKAIKHLESYLAANKTKNVFLREVEERLESAKLQLKECEAPSYLENLNGTIGADPFDGQI